jgi:DNA-binding NarL/FixJ family response regulator
VTDAIRVLLADDHPILRKGIRVVLEDAGIVVVAEVDDGAAALDAIETLAPDIAILDLDMPKMDGVAVAHRDRGPTSTSKSSS